MARLLVAALVAACYIACASAQRPPADTYPDGPCVCNGNYGQKPYKHITTGQVQYWPCEPYECESALSPGEIAGIAVGCVVFLILIIIIIVWCFYCGCDCDCDDRPMHRYPSNDDVYVRQAVPAVRPQFVQAAPLQTTCVVPPPQPTIQVIKAPNFQHSVIPQQQVVVQKSVSPQITYLS